MTGQELVDDLILAWYQTQHANERMILLSPLGWSLIQQIYMNKAAFQNDLHYEGYEFVFRGIPMVKTNSNQFKMFKIVTEVVHR